MKKIIILLTTVLSIGCSNTQTNINTISVGMTKAEVVNAMGQPDTSRATDGVEYLVYSLTDAPSAGKQTACGSLALFTLGATYLSPDCQSAENDFFVQLVQGRVRAYGKVGDFDSTKNPEATININSN